MNLSLFIVVEEVVQLGQLQLDVDDGGVHPGLHSLKELFKATTTYSKLVTRVSWICPLAMIASRRLEKASS
jgi:hypothetical protein